MQKKASKKEIIANRLSIAREQAGLSQTQVAHIMRMHRPTVSEIEAGRRNVSAEELLEFANLYEVSISWLADEKNEEYNEKNTKIELAAREASKLSDADYKKVINLLEAIRGTKIRDD